MASFFSYPEYFDYACKHKIYRKSSRRLMSKPSFFFLIALVILCVLGRVTINIGIVQANGRAKKSGDAWARLHPFTWLLPNEWQLMGLEGADSQRGRRCGNIKHCLLLLFHHPVLSVGCVLALRPSFVNRCGNLCVRSVCVISRRRRRRRR